MSVERQLGLVSSRGRQHGNQPPKCDASRSSAVHLRCREARGDLGHLPAWLQERDGRGFETDRGGIKTDRGGTELPGCECSLGQALTGSGGRQDGGKVHAGNYGHGRPYVAWPKLGDRFIVAHDGDGRASARAARLATSGASWPTFRRCHIQRAARRGAACRPDFRVLRHDSELASIVLVADQVAPHDHLVAHDASYQLRVLDLRQERARVFRLDRN
ncbi:hypothetical protein PHYPSEUDO_010936 [Phytophthora pseudosyringae]|uniref:Uncharacterized protein n=1 Tax=Phytophthora pseudosyringae TaxID=221518 RepID=A0A8T1VC29_9STRA|nr:hypothetical protein PHYPSEUDO_010936 [Phytophthora pseudosyringae]